MTSRFKISTACRNAAVDGIVDLIDGGLGDGYVEIRTGSPPASVAAADIGTLLGTLTFSDPAFGAAAAGVATANSITSDTSADASGDAGYFRTHDSTNASVFQGKAGEAADSTDMTFDNKTIVAGGTIAISSMTVTMPEG
jgi:hypothetical protein